MNEVLGKKPKLKICFFYFFFEKLDLWRFFGGIFRIFEKRNLTFFDEQMKKCHPRFLICLREGKKKWKMYSLAFSRLSIEPQWSESRREGRNSSVDAGWKMICCSLNRAIVSNHHLLKFCLFTFWGLLVPLLGQKMTLWSLTPAVNLCRKGRPYLRPVNDHHTS